MADPLRQPTAPSQPAWVRLCQWLFRGLLFIWVNVVLVLASNLLFTWLTTKGFTPTGTPLGGIIQHLPVALACGGILLVLTIVSGVLSRQDESFDSHPLLTLPQENRCALIDLLQKEYHSQITESLGEVSKMALALQWRRDVTLSSVSLVSWRMDAPDDHSSSAHDPIMEAYDAASAGLLILGAPGAGKSTLLRELAFKLLIRARDDATKPIPVNVNLSSWAIKKPPLTAWMVDRLWETYHVPRRVSQALIEQNQLLFLLDGLDEVELSARTKCIEAINTYLAEQGRIVSIVVCARSHVYPEKEERLRLSGAVEVRPLTPEQVKGCLEGAGKSMSAVLSARRSKAVLRELITTPLMLSVVMLAYRGKTAKDLPQLGSAEDQQREVFERYVTRMLEEQTRKWCYTSNQTRQWLIWLAQHMKQDVLTDFYLERLQPDWLPADRSHLLYRVLVGRFSFALAGGIIIGLLTGLLVKAPTNTFIEVLLGGLTFGGLAGVVVTGAVVGPDTKIQPPEKIRWSWVRFWQKRPNMIRVLWAGARGGLLWFGVPFALIVFVFELFTKVSFWQRITSVLAVLLTLPSIFALLMLIIVSFAWFISGWSRATIDPDPARPNQGIWDALRNALIFGSLGGLASGILVSGLLFGSPGGPLFGLLVGVLVGLSLCIWCGGATCIRHFALRFILWRSGAVTWHYVRFLEEARERILLQRVGGGYRFIHPLLQDYFASLGTGTSASIQSHPSSLQP